MFHIRIYARLAYMFASITLAASGAYAQDLVGEPLPVTWQNEAALRDVCFVDTQHGWAVGDHGVILKTTDGGRHWKALADVNRSIEDWNHAAGELSLREKLQGVQDRRVQAAVSTSKGRIPKVSCQLNSVFFLNRRLGWAAGGYGVPLLNRTRSVVLKTVDGGVNWIVMANSMPPHIKQIEFTDPRTGWAVGDSSTSYASGIYFTRDGGATWQDHPLADRQQHHDWIAASRHNAKGQRLIGVSTTGHLKFSQGTQSNQGNQSNRVDNAAVLAQREQHFYDIAMTDADNGWAVGSMGAIFRTRDRGLSWQAPASLAQLAKQPGHGDHALPIDQIDFLSIATTDTKVWVAGKPGGCFVSIDKQSGVAKIHRTPITSAIHRVAFVDENHGWAVGDLGIVLATTDGGETWQIQRAGQTRIGLLSVCFDEQELPLKLLAQYACEDDVLCGTVGMSKISTHLHQSAGRCGNAIFHRLILPDVDGAQQQQSAVIRRLVTEIRTHRPSCIVLNPSAEQSIASTLDREKLLQLAIHSAADSTFESDRYEAINLKPWQVQRMAIADIAGTMSVGGDKFLPHLAATINDRIFISRSLLGMDLPTSMPSTYRVDRFLGRGVGGQSTTVVSMDCDLLTGLHALPRRTKTQHPPGDLSMLGRRNRKRESFKRILQTEVNDADSMFAWQNEMLGLMVSVDRRTAGNWFLQLADEAFAENKPELAAQTMDLLVQRIPEHAYTPAALLWLASYYASQEYSRRAFSHTLKHADAASASAAIAKADYQSSRPALTAPQVNREDNGDQELAWAVPDENLLNRQIQNARKRRLSDDSVTYSAQERKLFELGDALAGKVQSAAETATVSSAAEVEMDQSKTLQATSVEPISASPVRVPWSQFMAARRQIAAKYLARLRGRDPDLSLSPQTVAVELTLLQDSQQEDQSRDRLKQLLKTTPNLDSEIRRAISLLSRDRLVVNAEDVVCSMAGARPLLDGKFSDDLWRSAFDKKAFRQMKNADVIFFARDDEFLYWIARMNKQAGYKYAHQKKRRIRDAQLQSRDRIEIALDCDRDGRTQFRFAIDHRGWVNESFDAMSDWDPDWYVSQSEDEESWTVEAAIPLSALRFGINSNASQRSVDVSKPWSVQLNRYVLEENVWNDVRSANGSRSMLDLIGAGCDDALFVFE